MASPIRPDRFVGEGSFPFSIWDAEPTDIGEDRSSAHLTGAFLHSRLFTEALVNPSTNDRDLLENPDQFIQMCLQQQQGNESLLKLVDEFRQKYNSQEAVTWYTRESFIYRLLNRALRVEDIRTLVACRFLIHDIHEQLRTLNESTQVGKNTICYRGQHMSRDELDTLRRSVGSIILMKSFLSTTLCEDVALILVDNPNVDSSDEDIEQVLFEITFEQPPMSFSFEESFANISETSESSDEEPFANTSETSEFFYGESSPSISETDEFPAWEPFANITEISEFPSEKEILFSLGSLFRINDVRNEEGKFWRIYLEYMPLSKSPLQADDGNQLNRIYNRMGEHEAGAGMGMGRALHLAGKLNQAEAYYRQMIDYTSQLDPQILQQREEEGELYKILSQSIGVPKEKTNHTKRIETQLTYYRFQLALVTRDKGDDDACLLWCKYLRNLNPDPEPEFPDARIYSCYYHLLTGEVYEHSGQLRKALYKYRKALAILQTASEGTADAFVGSEILIDLANVLMSISKDANKPLRLYERALKLCQKSRPTGHPRIGLARLKIADYYRNRSEFKLALIKYEECRQIFVRSLPPDHVYLGLTYYGMGICYKLTGSRKNLEQVESSLEQAATIFKKHLVPNHRYLLRTEQLLRRLRERTTPSDLPRLLDQWNEDDVNRFLTERQFTCLSTLYGKMNGRALRNFYRICTGNECMLHEINADLATIDKSAPRDQLTVDQYNRLLNELKIYAPNVAEPNSTTSSVACVVA